MSQTATAARGPLLRIAKREGTTMPQKIAVRAIAILLALVVDALFIFFVTGLNPLAVYGVMWGGTFANMSFGVLGFTVDSTTRIGNIGKDTRRT